MTWATWVTMDVLGGFIRLVCTYYTQGCINIRYTTVTIVKLNINTFFQSTTKSFRNYNPYRNLDIVIQMQPIPLAHEGWDRMKKFRISQMSREGARAEWVRF